MTQFKTYIWLAAVAVVICGIVIPQTASAAPAPGYYYQQQQAIPAPQQDPNYRPYVYGYDQDYNQPAQYNNFYTSVEPEGAVGYRGASKTTSNNPTNYEHLYYYY